MSSEAGLNAERRRLEAQRLGHENWRLWGPYLSERAWGTVREDYSPYGDAWDFVPHDHARSRAYRWSEDGLGGICDDRQYLCLALALWNERDPILKERAFELRGEQGNRGEDVKNVTSTSTRPPATVTYATFTSIRRSPFPMSAWFKRTRRVTGPCSRSTCSMPAPLTETATSTWR